jgi:hypothetical protein
MGSIEIRNPMIKQRASPVHPEWPQGGLAQLRATSMLFDFKG